MSQDNKFRVPCAVWRDQSRENEGTAASFPAAWCVGVVMHGNLFVLAVFSLGPKMPAGARALAGSSDGIQGLGHQPPASRGALRGGGHHRPHLVGGRPAEQ